MRQRSKGKDATEPADDQPCIQASKVFSCPGAGYRKSFIQITCTLKLIDKLAAQLGVAKRNVFHRQIRMAPPSNTAIQEIISALIDPSQKSLYVASLASHMVTIGHELGHSLGPQSTSDGRDKKATLGTFGDTIEENKADVMSIFQTDNLVKTGELTQEEANRIYMSWAFSNFPIKQPLLSQPYPTRNVMQANFFIEKGAFVIDLEARKLSIVPEKMNAAAREMLAEITRIQLAGSESEARAFVEKYNVWTETMQHFADTQLKLTPKPKIFTEVKLPASDAILANK